MPKYLTRQEFEQMKVLRNRRSTIKQIATAMHLAVSTVSRNLKYNSYEDYVMSMYARNSKSQKETEAKSGPVKTIQPTATKKCRKCGQTKPLDEFDKDKDNKDGRSGQCKECRREYQREYNKKTGRRKSKTSVKEPAKPTQECVVWHDAFKQGWFSEPSKDDDEDDKLSVGEYVFVSYKGKVRDAQIVAKCAGYSNRWVVELCNWRGTKVVCSEDDIYTEG